MIQTAPAILTALGSLVRMPAFLTRVFSALAGWLSLSRLTGWLVTFFTFGLFTIGIPLAIEWGLFNVLTIFGSQISDNFDLSATVISLSGVAAWLADCFNLPAVLSVQLGFASLSLLVRLVATRNIVRY